MNEKESLIVCECCGLQAVHETYTETKFEYGEGKEQVILSALSPVMSCSNCGFEYMDHRGEVARHDAVCEYLGLLTSTEIRDVRIAFDASIQRFSEVTSIGTASLGRWENGQTLQSKAYDKYLRLLGIAGNFAALARMDDTASHDISPHLEPTFRAINVNNPQMLARAREFCF